MSDVMAHAGDVSPLVFILVAGFLATGAWRFAAVLLGGAIDPAHPVFEWARAVAASIVAAQSAILVVSPMGPLLDVPLGWRIGAVLAGFLVYHFNARSVLLGVLAGDGVVLAAILLRV